MGNWIADQIGNAAGGLVYLFGGGAAEQARGNQLDAQLQTLNNQEYGKDGRIYDEIAAERGIPVADQAFLQVQNDMEAGKTGDVLEQLQTAGQEGANAGLKGFWSTIAKALGGVLGIFPWWLWLVAGGALFVYLGGLQWLEREARKKLA